MYHFGSHCRDVSLKEAFTLFRSVVLFLLGVGIGAFIYEFVPTDLLANFAVAVVTGYVFNYIL